MNKITERFEEKFMPEPNSGCWIWIGGIANKARKAHYGKAFLNGKSYLAHKVSWIIHFGETGSKYVCHKCDNTLCVNPSHLFLGTQKENIRDCILKGRKTPPPIGLRGRGKKCAQS